jgi:hypothetical protein
MDDSLDEPVEKDWLHFQSVPFCSVIVGWKAWICPSFRMKNSDTINIAPIKPIKESFYIPVRPRWNSDGNSIDPQSLEKIIFDVRSKLISLSKILMDEQIRFNYRHCAEYH